MTIRKLTLNSEALAELAAADLAAVVGGEAVTGQCFDATLPDPACLTVYGSRCIH